MKKILLSILFISITAYTLGQVKDAEEVILERPFIGNTNGFKIFVTKASSKALEVKFKRWMREYNVKVERNKKTGESVVNDVDIPSMGEDAYTIYVAFSETSEGGFLTSFVAVGDVFVTSHTHLEEAVEWARLLKKFSAETTSLIVKEQLEAGKKKLQSMSKELEKLKKDKEGYERDIKTCEEKITERKEQLTKNADEQLTVQSKIAKKEQDVDKIKAELKKYQN
jgi:hypothetical protein